MIIWIDAKQMQTKTNEEVKVNEQANSLTTRLKDANARENYRKNKKTEY